MQGGLLSVIYCTVEIVQNNRQLLADRLQISFIKMFMSVLFAEHSSPSDYLCTKLRAQQRRVAAPWGCIDIKNSRRLSTKHAGPMRQLRETDETRAHWILGVWLQIQVDEVCILRKDLEPVRRSFL